ncbi:hypothetical protein A3Q56_02592 [Intoshia linei]|uniref:NLE domain-containing protein n=1 Tax=Intoshia linei TaxID=1819745 RepID=A0A177B5U3_9BILA|nr:hypothetical protein A3Q56_02592 [Intoshia linei]
MELNSHILARLISPTGTTLSEAIDLPVDVDNRKLNLILNQLLENDDNEQYAFFVNENEIKTNLHDTISQIEDKSLLAEKTLNIQYRPQSPFHVKAVTRCTSSMEGHTEAVVSAQFSSNGRYLCSGSGDTTVRFWNIYTELPQFSCKGHKNWVLVISWSPDDKFLASACKNGQIIIWNPVTGEQKLQPIKAHKKWINAISWKPLNIDGTSNYFVSASKDTFVKIWDATTGCLYKSLGGHAMSVTCVRWSHHNVIYTSSQDRTIKMWRPDDGVLCRTFEGHSHWVNSISLNTDYAIRTGAFDPVNAKITNEPINESASKLKIMASNRLKSLMCQVEETLVSCSDDFTLFLWKPQTSKVSVCRMTGHQNVINDVKFSPNGFMIASASFDKSVKLWSGIDGKFIATFRGHVQRVYLITWSADSRYICSASADSTLKVWNVSQKKILLDLPGHADEVYAVDWSPDCQRVVSGGKDRVLKMYFLSFSMGSIFFKSQLMSFNSRIGNIWSMN